MREWVVAGTGIVGAQHAFTDETALGKVKDPSQQRTQSGHGEKCC